MFIIQNWLHWMSRLGHYSHLTPSNPSVVQWGLTPLLKISNPWWRKNIHIYIYIRHQKTTNNDGEDCTMDKPAMQQATLWRVVSNCVASVTSQKFAGLWASVHSFPLKPPGTESLSDHITVDSSGPTPWLAILTTTLQRIQMHLKKWHTSNVYPEIFPQNDIWGLCPIFNHAHSPLQLPRHLCSSTFSCSNCGCSSCKTSSSATTSCDNLSTEVMWRRFCVLLMVYPMQCVGYIYIYTL